MNYSFRVGETVLWKKWNKKGRIVEINKKRKKARISVADSSLFVWISWSELSYTSSEPHHSSANSDFQNIHSNTTAFHPVLDLHGETVEDGLNDADSFLHQAFARKIHRVEIIHGEGTGKLRNAVRGYLQNNPIVKDYEYAHPCMGGLGVTIVYLNI